VPSRGVILGPQQPKPRLEILVPRGYEDAPRELFGRCHVCDATFYRGQEALWESHVGRCARAHLDEIRAQAPSHRNKGTVFDKNEWDPEVEAHMRRVGERMVREGRMIVLPHERAGFS